MESLSLVQWAMVAGAAVLLLSNNGMVKSMLSAIWSKSTTKDAALPATSDESNVAAYKTIRHKLIAISPDLAKQVWDAIQPTDDQ